MNGDQGDSRKGDDVWESKGKRKIDAGIAGKMQNRVISNAAIIDRRGAVSF